MDISKFLTLLILTIKFLQYEKFYYLYFAIAFTIISCDAEEFASGRPDDYSVLLEKDSVNTDTTENDIRSVLLSSSSKIDLDSGVNYPSKFKYNGNQIIVETNDDKYTKYFYNGDLITNIETISELPTETPEYTKETFRYDSQGRVTNHKKGVVKYGIQPPEPENYTETIYMYNDSDTDIVTYSKVAFEKGKNPVKIEYGKLTYKYGNLLTKESFYYPNQSKPKTTITQYSYDEGNSPMINVEGYAKLLHLYHQSSVNNLTQLTETTLQYEQVIQTKTISIDYAYDDNSFPTHSGVTAHINYSSESNKTWTGKEAFKY